ncbi:MAG TPA: hypothetical protein VMZ26_03450, partial [Pyrinomonadaceae bacterium]|nr:hypothetical protein [Pyrinomonadaceae bacterium]
MNDVTFTECEFGADMVPYMYAELPAKKSAAFEAHLLLCSACTDEFASLSNARYEVYDWKKLEFDGLATPTFEAPFESGPEHIAPTWVDKMREAFWGSWAVPGIAF